MHFLSCISFVDSDGHQQVEKAEMVKDKTSELAKKVETTDSGIDRLVLLLFSYIRFNIVIIID